MKRLHEFNDAQHLNQEVCRRLITVSNDCLANKGSFHLVLAGGSTPRQLYQQLKQATDAQWQGWHIYFSDERCLPTGDEQRNDNMAKTAWLDHVAIPQRQIHPIEAQLGSRQGAINYDRLLQHCPRFDLVLLGIGEDGHTASLFPGDTDTGPGFSNARPVTRAPKPPAERVSMTPDRLSRSDRVWFLVSGENKRPALQAWLQNQPSPASQIKTANGVDVFSDQNINRDAR
jgi:6-phosphogluconolactonase